MMLFRTVKASIINNILGPAEAGRFKTVGFQRQVLLGDEEPTVQVYYRSGDFSKSSAAINGPTKHDMRFSFDLKVAAKATGDLSVIQNPDATAGQLATALMNFQNAAELADDKLDELFEIVYQILMGARNQWLGLTKGTVSNRWISNIEKEDPLPQGSVVVLNGRMDLTCRAQEEIAGDSVTPANIFDMEIEIQDDNVQKTGTFVDNTQLTFLMVAGGDNAFAGFIPIGETKSTAVCGQYGG